MASQKTFQCRVCKTAFSIPEAALAKYPGWEPSVCRSCKSEQPGAKKAGGQSRRSGGGKGKSRSSRGGATHRPNLNTSQVLEQYNGGPSTGLFTDGSASPNPGPGGWGVVYVVDGEVIDRAHGSADHTTNNRMELQALIEAYKMGPESVELDIWTDSDLCVKSMTQWAAAWEKRGWTRKTGPIKNVELVKELYEHVKRRPNLHLKWIKAHDGSLWNEYADALASAYSRDEV